MENEEENKKEVFLQRFNEQSYLMLNWENLVKSNEQNYKQFAYVHSEDTYSFVNKIFKRKSVNYEKLLNLNSAQLSALVPKIRIYKQYIDQDTGKSFDVEMLFDDKVSKFKLDNITKDRSGRGGGAGIQGFSWVADGKTIGEKSLFGATLTLYFQGLDELFEIRDTVDVRFSQSSKPVKLETRFSDLIMQPPQFKTTEVEGERIYNIDYFRIKVNVGWSILNNQELFDKETYNAINSLNESFYLTVYNHELSFDEVGAVTLTINYRAYVEALVSDITRSNVLQRPIEDQKYIDQAIEKKIKTQKELEKAQEEQKTSLAEEKEKELKNLDNQLASYKTEVYSYFVRELLESEKIKFIDASVEEYDYLFSLNENNSMQNVRSAMDFINQVKKENEQTAIYNFSPVGESLAEAEAITNSVNESQKNKFSPPKERRQEDGKYRILFFYLGDLIEISLKRLFNPKNNESADFLNKELRVMLGPVTFYDYGTLEDSGNVVKIKSQDGEKYKRYFTGKKTTVNIADIPISLSVFTNWFIKNIVEPGNLKYTFKQFVESIINELVFLALGQESLLPIPTQKVQLSFKTVSLPKNKKREEIFKTSTRSGMSLNDGSYADNVQPGRYYCNASDFENAPLIADYLSNKDGANEPLENYLIIYGSSEKSWRLRQNSTKDQESGIYSIIYGEEKGLVKKIAFKKMDVPEYNAALIHKAYVENEGQNTLLRGIYEANVEMFGNTLYELGSIIYIHPHFPGFSFNNFSSIGNNKNAIDLGIAGYYMVTGIDHEIDLTKYTTKLKLVWNSRGRGYVSIGDLEIPQSLLVKPEDIKKDKDIIEEIK